jgi:hypothetical protein
VPVILIISVGENGPKGITPRLASRRTGEALLELTQNKSAATATAIVRIGDILFPPARQNIRLRYNGDVPRTGCCWRFATLQRTT